MPDLTALQLIEMALKETGAYYPGQVIPAAEAEEARLKLNMLLGIWGAEKIMVPSIVSESFALTASHNPHTWILTTGDIPTDRPHQLISAFIRDTNGMDTPVFPMTEAQYNLISTKTFETRPERAFYKPTYPSGLLYLYPIPDASYALYTTSIKPLTDVTGLTDSLTLPPQYQAALLYSLSVMLCPAYSRPVGQDLASLAATSLATVRRLNAANQVEPVRLELYDFYPRSRIEEG